MALLVDPYELYFDRDSLRAIYHSKLQHKTTVGIDRLGRQSFERQLEFHLEVASRKCLGGNYEFSSYREKLILKGRDSHPRVISIPTVRDSIVLRALNDYLQERCKPHISARSVHGIVGEIKKILEENEADFFLKIDIQNFFPSIDLSILESKLQTLPIDQRALALASKAARKSTISAGTDHTGSSGVPQGLSISNLLANIYLTDFDKEFLGREDLKYFRFVDDILILCKMSDAERLAGEVETLLAQVSLRVNESKSARGKIAEGFAYLGYSFDSHFVSVREGSVRKLIDSIIETLAQYKYSRDKNLEILEWKLNLRIGGFQIGGQRYGWIFFFSQIDDLSLLFHLDFQVARLLKRFGIPKDKIKRFVRSYHEITRNLGDSTYIPNFDAWELRQKRDLLYRVYRIDAEKLAAAEVERLFQQKINQMIRDIERDLQRGS